MQIQSPKECTQSRHTNLIKHFEEWKFLRLYQQSMVHYYYNFKRLGETRNQISELEYKCSNPTLGLLQYKSSSTCIVLLTE